MEANPSSINAFLSLLPARSGALGGWERIGNPDEVSKAGGSSGFEK
jgi:hypothetical protein